MHTYRLYFHGADGHIVQAEPFECADDRQAVAFALRKADHRPMELWQQARRVMVFPKERQSVTS